ncbi:hypothetical protein Vretimale_5360 [Volvox reticuliferus]|uniref:Uncharacterized protein n=1 Tax=Volvox reticuliferus TaxID=1737510 RepID=A0A8J4G4S3_9CHLO|nr:hypothetical protein Vretifemale_3886 [Volvox reticuliferus]GIM00200.1 hypothetical protein Vretimale_5360 [Volvox reticuliferus]
MAQPHGKHHHQNHPKSYSWAAIMSGVLIVSTLALVGTQVLQARRIAGSRPLLIFGRRKLHRVVHFSEYKQVVPELLEHAEPHFVAFTSGVDNQGRPWCGDCAAAMPIIREVVLGAGGSLLEVSVGKREDWANRQHPMRVDPDCPVRFVPTLYYWSEKGCGSSVANPLNNDETEESLRLIVAKFVQQTASGQRYVDRITREIIESGGKGCGGC